jgi:3-hydroxypropanoate dehydrogenase
MGHTIDDSALDTLYREARTYTAWQPRPVTDQTLRDLYDLLKWAPTSANATPARFAFLRSKEAKERLRPALAAGNVEKTMTAPRHRDRRVRHEVLRATAQTVPS